MAYDYNDVSLDDLERIVANKRKSQNIFTGTQKWDSPEQFQLKAANDEIRKKYGITGDDMTLKYAEELLKQKKNAANPIVKTGLPVKDTTIYKTPFTEPLLRGVEGREKFLFGGDITNLNDNPIIAALRKENERAGENAYNSAIGNMTEFTGGRLNSWAAKAAADSKQAYADKGDAEVANYVQMLLSGQKSFTDDVFGYDTGFYDRDYQERQTPILNEQTNRELDIKEKLADNEIADTKAKIASGYYKKTSGTSATATTRSMNDYYNGLVSENLNTDGESLYANLINNQDAYVKNMGAQNFAKAVKYARDKYYQTVLNRWKGNETDLVTELRAKPQYYQNVLGIENYNKLLNLKGSSNGNSLWD